MKKNIYLILAIFSVLAAWGTYFSYPNAPFDPDWRVLFGGPLVASFTVDFLISMLVFWGYMFREHRHNGGPKPYIFMAITFIGLCTAMLAYAYARTPSSPKS